MQAGRLRHYVTLERLELVPDGGGGYSEQWVPVAAEWASIEGISGREFIAAQAVQAETTYRVTMRYRAIDPAWRLVSDGLTYGIEAVLPNNDRTRLTLMCKVL